MRRLEGKTAFITGCNRGIGRAAVERFIREGANVYCALRKPNADFEQWATERAKENNVNASFVYFDLSDEEQTKVALKDLAKTKPQIDILINNAGMADGMLMLMTPAKRMKEVFQVNFFSQVIVTQHIAKIMMKHKKGSIINMCSVAGLDNYGGVFLYGTSKAAMAQLTRVCANELSPFGIRCNGIAPGLIDTEMGGQMTDKSQALMLDRSNMHRRGTPEEIVNLMLFLASDESSYINGQIIRADGGM
jgi:3-oxoacyl-[acyl-carrier protein] reductase